MTSDLNDLEAQLLSSREAIEGRLAELCMEQLAGGGGKVGRARDPIPAQRQGYSGWRPINE